jgi:uncharacterized OsmC-like protein
MKIEQTIGRPVNVRVHGESENPTRMKLQSGKFKMIIDEPENMGGTNDGPSPVQVLLMSLAGCLNVTGHEVAKQRGMHLNRLNISIEGNMNACNFMGCSFDERAGFQQIKVRLKPEFENVTEGEVESWAQETEARCPVTDNIKDATEIMVSHAALV